eukprot:TRINITY_DN9223_c0_g1_i4.p1 TRINITY_DN9223_c0_g1~~TRINITY_DN9223_c0_g1_i4.p1  ORF type:complete len:237 (-),score=38.14 TRINITY_DN9223_c0_g1_i4:222-932(-)
MITTTTKNNSVIQSLHCTLTPLITNPTEQKEHWGNKLLFSAFSSSKTPPFWYSNEERDQLVEIWQKYSCFLSCPYRKTKSRRLPEFVGKITRVQLHPDSEYLHDLDGDSYECADDSYQSEEDWFECDDIFCTLDKVEIYRWDLRLLGSTLTMVAFKELITYWDVEQGLPRKFIDITDCPPPSYTLDVIMETRSFIHCLPVWSSHFEYEVVRSNEDRSVGYAHEPFNFTKYLPRECL